MARIIVTIPVEGDAQPDKTVISDLKTDFTGETQDRKGTISRFKTYGNCLEFTITPDDVADQVIAAAQADTSLVVAKVNRFGSFAARHKLGPQPKK